MSEKSKGDTSTPPPSTIPIQTRVVKNPLLSASVTGLTFDDFPNKPFLLPAAPPVTVITPVTTTVASTPTASLVPSIGGRGEPKSLVTVGSSISDVDTENLDEINLNSISDETTQAPLIDTNSNSLIGQQQANSDSILSQAALSFSALPSVASSVFSTFSKRIYSTGNSRERTPTTDDTVFDPNANSVPVLNIQPYYKQPQEPAFASSDPFTEVKQEIGVLATPPVTSVLDTTPPEPPKFYTPSEVSAFPASAGAPPATGPSQNTYRLSAKKKVYAPIPGLANQGESAGAAFNTTPQIVPPIVQQGLPPIQPQPLPPLPFDSYGYQQNIDAYPAQEFPKQEERKGGLFSLSNLVPSGVLQNISGLVQSAAGSFTQSSKSDHQLQLTSYPDQLQETNYFDLSQAPQATSFAPSPIAYATALPPNLNSSNYFTSSPQPLPTQSATTSEVPHIDSQISTSNTFIQPPPSAGFVTSPPKSATPKLESSLTSDFSNLAIQKPVSIFNPTNSSSSFTENTTPTAAFIQPIHSNVNEISTFTVPNSDINPLPSVNQASSNFFQSGNTPFVGPSNPPLPTSEAITSAPTNFALIDTTKVAPGIPPPPFAANQPPPSSGHSSFRLQKGTRHYKSPLTSAETVPSPLNQQVPTVGPPVLNPLAGTLNSSFFVPNVSCEPQSVSLFTVDDSKAPVDIPHTFNPVQISAINLAECEPVSSTSNFPTVSPTDSSLIHSEILKEEATSKDIIDPLDEVVQKLSGTTDALKTEEGIVEEPSAHISHDELIQKLSDTVEKATVKEVTSHILPPPTAPIGNYNPYRKDNTPKSTEVPTNQQASPALAQFFTPAITDNNSSNDFNFFNQSKPVSENTEAQTASPSITSDTVSLVFDPSSLTIEAQPEPTQAVNFFNTSKQEFEPIPFQPSAPPCTAVCSFPPLPDFNSIPPSLLQSESIVALPSATTTLTQSAIPPPPIGFENFTVQPLASNETQPTVEDISQINSTDSELKDIEHTEHSDISLNLFSNNLEQTSKFPAEQSQQSQKQLPKTSELVAGQNLSNSLSSFFDTVPLANSIAAINPGPIVQQSQTNEEQRIQNFFNNPPPKESGGGFGDLNYELVHRGVAVKTLQTRSLTPASNIVEPPSSSCSEWSELNTSNVPNVSNLANAPSIPTYTRLSEEFTVKTNIEKDKQEEISESKVNPGVVEAKTSNFQVKYYEELPEEILKELRMANVLKDENEGAINTTEDAPMPSISYKPAIKHWFYKLMVSDKPVWTPFSHYNSALLETTLLMGDDAPNLVAVEGGRYDVNIRERKKAPVYWEGDPIEVRRCSWFFKAVDNKYVPYEEETAELLEAEYKQAAESGVWHKKIVLTMGEQVVFHGPTVIVHFQQQQNTDSWGGSSQTTTRPRVVKRDLDDFIIEQGESQRVDHLLFMVHGIGAACDLKMRSVEEVVDDFRSIAQQLVQSHYKNSTDMGQVGRVEVLPISWHDHLHSEEMGIDEKLKSITLESIPRLRNFTNDTLLDVLFYTSPTFCQKIMNTVVASMNSVYHKYRQRHPDFNGGVSLAGHSLGSLILFDLLCHQHPAKESEEQNKENPDQEFTPTHVSPGRNGEGLSRQISYTMGHAGTGQPFIHYPQLVFQPKKFFALGSPIGMFVTIRGIDKLGLDFRLPTCPGFYNIFHPFDPVAYRIEALVNPDMSGIRPVLIPHHKGRKRMHLELKETMTRVGADLKQRFFDTFKTTLDSVNFLGTSAKSKRKDEEAMEKEVDKALEMQMQLEHAHQQQQEQRMQSTVSTTQVRIRTESISGNSDGDIVEVDFPLGKLNDSKRIDYVLQEAPLEFFNEYLFALSSHVCYWESEDTILFVMKEIYSGLGISPDSQVPQQTMTIERPNSRNSVSQSLLSPNT